MELAAKGLPSGDGVGFEIFDKGQFGLSDFVQRTNYLRALQGELSRTISELHGVRSARVMIVQPENRLLLTDQGIKPTASVFVELAGTRLEPEAVNAIRNLVANSVQGLQPDQVAVVDNQGHVLSEDLKQDPALGSAASQMRYRQQIEDYLAKKVETMLRPGHRARQCGGAGLGRDRDRCHHAHRGEVRSGRPGRAHADHRRGHHQHHGIAHRRRGGRHRQRTRQDRVKRHRETHFDQRTEPQEPHDDLRDQPHHHQHVRTPGALKNLTAAVFIAQRAPGADGQAAKRTAEELAALRQLVINALGVHAAAGQSLDNIVSLQEMPFQAAAVSAQVEQIQKETRVATWFETASRYFAVGIALAVLGLFWRMLRHQKPEAVPVEMLSDASGTVQRGMPAQGAVTPELLNELIRQKPTNIGIALRDWAAVKKN